ncbi:MAG: hypothetical protein KHW46_01550 [Clostridiales bacterium]|nr:hypothetical protein [Clostridiales bacterium]
MRDFTVKDFFKAILDHIVVFVLIPFIAVAVTAFISSNVLPPVYTAKTSLYVMNQASDTITSSDVNTSTLLVNDYRAFAQTDRVTKQAAQIAGLEDLDDFTVSISSETNTRMLYVNVEGKDQQKVAVVANALAQTLSECILEVTNTENISVIDPAVTPTEASGPSLMRNVLAAGLIGLVVLALFILILEMTNTRIRNADDVEKLLDLPVLGQIPREDNGEDKKWR